jgi:hypothetical protein
MESRRVWWPYGALAAEILVFYRLVLFVPGYAIPWDFRAYHFPLASFIAKSFSRGELPLWDPYSYCGTPFYANIQAQLFYPPTLIAILASNSLAPGHLLYLLELQLIGHALLAGIFTYWLLRRLGLGPVAATTGATVYQLGAFFASQTEHLGAIDTAAWLPLALWCVVALSQNPRPVYVAALALAFGMSLLAGMPAVAAVVVGAAILVALAYIAFREAPAKLLLYVLGASAWGFLLAGVQLLPTLELTRRSVAQYRSDFMAGHGGLPLQSLVSLVLPNHYSVFDLSHYSLPHDPTHVYTYCGIVGLVLAAIGAARRSRVAWIFLSVAIVAAFAMLGEFTRAGKLALTILPHAVQSVVYPEEFLALFTMGVAVLAGLGSHGCTQRFRRGILGYVLLAVTAADCIAVSSSRPMNTVSTLREPGVSYEQFNGSRELLDRMRALTNQTVPPARLDTVDGSLDWASAAPLLEIPTANGNDPLALVRYMQVRLSLVKNGARWGRYYQVSIPESPVLSLLNVRYLLSRTSPATTLVKVADVPGGAVYENPRVLPRFFLVNRIERVADMEEGLAILRSARFRPGDFAVVEGAPRFEDQSAPEDHAPVRVVLYTPRRVVIETEALHPAFLLTSETYYPGWRAYVDGEEQRLFLTDVAFRGLPVPAGRHRIEMRFGPSALWRGLGISALAGLGLIGVVAFSKRR